MRSVAANSVVATMVALLLSACATGPRRLDSGVLPPGLPFSEAVQSGNTLYLSGQIGVVPGTLELVKGGVEAEARQTMENIRAVLEAHGLGMRDLVKCTVMLEDIADWPRFNEVYAGFFDGGYPARSAFGVDGLALGASVEVECIADAGRLGDYEVIRLYDYWESGNAYKVRLLLSLLGIPFERVELDILKGETRTPTYLAKNPNDRVPMVEWPDGRTLAESNAILFHLAEGSAYLPSDAWQRAEILQWMFFEQYSHEPCIAVVRFWHFSGRLEANSDALPAKVEGGYHALEVMEKRLGDQTFLVGDAYSVADIALYAYTHVADEGGFDLARFPGIRAWMARVAAQPGHVKITDRVGTEAAFP